MKISVLGLRSECALHALDDLLRSLATRGFVGESILHSLHGSPCGNLRLLICCEIRRREVDWLGERRRGFAGTA